jgi:hypothetical protein
MLGGQTSHIYPNRTSARRVRNAASHCQQRRALLLSAGYTDGKYDYITDKSDPRQYS